MAKTCLAHPDRPAVSMCHHCHKPVCAACAVVTPQGKFCSPECGLLFRDFRERAGELKKAGELGTGVKVVLLLLAMVLITFAAGIAVRYGLVPRLLKNAEVQRP